MDFMNSLIQLENIITQLKAGCEQALSQVINLRQESQHDIESDDLTHLLRRNSFMSRLQHLLHKAQQNKGEVHIMLMDVDHFKAVNDRFGHQAGDEVLERVSTLIKNYLRPQDIAGRYGGEEIIVAVECPATVAFDIAERIRSAIAATKFVAPLSGTSHFQVTLSIGLASSSQHGFDATKLIQAADEKLYEAKNRGRNRTEQSQAA